MGARSNIQLKYKEGNIFIYSHWDDNRDMARKLRSALAKKLRWDDPSYLGRIIFDEVVRDASSEETGFGLAPYPGEEGYPTIVVDMDERLVDGKSFVDFLKRSA